MLQGKTAVITGARSGIGRATVELFAQNGANVYACIRKADVDFEEYLFDLSKKHNVWCKVIYIDMEDENQIKAGVKDIIQEKQNINILVNAAGIVGERRLFQMTSIFDMKHTFDVNFWGSMLMTQLISRKMCRQKSGAIINISSIAGIEPGDNTMEYSASKAAMINATKKLACELGEYNIRVNAVAPGLTDTKMLNCMLEDVKIKMVERSVMKRLGRPLEIANVVLFLASDMSSFITGQTICVDGGM
jgi:3-oxoacyl-[acyl-carrier protein] reductase